MLYMTRPWSWRIHRYDYTAFITFTCAVWVEAICLCLLLLIRSTVIVTNLIREPSTALAKPFDLFSMSNDRKAIDRMINRLHSGSGSSFRCVRFMLCPFARVHRFVAMEGLGSSPLSKASASLSSRYYSSHPCL